MIYFKRIVLNIPKFSVLDDCYFLKTKDSYIIQLNYFHIV